MVATAIRRHRRQTWCALLAAGLACWGCAQATAAPPRVFGDPSVAHPPPVRTYHIIHYKLTLHFDPSRGEVFGDERITLRPLVPRMNRFYLNSSGLTIEAVTFRGPAKQPITPPFRTSDSRVWITLPRAYGRSDVLGIEIRYRGFPRAGLYFDDPSAAYPHELPEIWSQGEPEFNRFWFPCWDYPNDMSTSEMVVTVPLGQSVVSNGRLVGAVVHGGQVTYDWVESVPHSSYLTSLAVGPWKVVRAHYHRLPIDYYVPRTASVATAQRSFHLTPDMIRFFSTALGVRYPYEKYSQVTVSHYFFGGMENVSATTLTAATLHSARADADYSSQDLVSHELGQQWFGDLVQGRDWADIWLNEGFATYLQALYTQHREGNDSFRLQMLQDQQAAIRQDRDDYLRPIVDDHYTDPMQMFDSITHQKGAVVLDMLRNLLDGQAAAARPASQTEPFFRALRSYLLKYRARAVDTGTLIRSLDASSGEDLHWFFREWVYMAGHPDYRVSARYHPREKLEALTVSQTQDGPGVPRVFVMPIQVDFHGPQGQSRRVVIDDRRRTQTFDVRLGFEPRWVDFDPHDIIEKQVVFAQSVRALVLEVRDDPAMAARLYAARRLGTVTGMHVEAAVSALSAALELDPFYGVRAVAARSLGQLHTRAAKLALVAALTEPNDRVRVAVIRALGRFRADPHVYGALLSRMRNDPSYAVEAAAAVAVGNSGNPEAYSVLARAAALETNRHVLGGIYAGLAATANPRALVLLAAGSRPGTRLALRLDALRALERPGPALSETVRADLVTAARAALDDSDLSIRDAGEKVAGAWGLTELDGSLNKLLRTAPTRFERGEVSRALRQLQHHSTGRVHASG